MQIQAEIYPAIDRKFKNSSWNSGASEAHGLLSGLACRGIRSEQLYRKAWLFQMSEQTEIELLAGLYGIILRDLQSTSFAFNLLLPDEHASSQQRVESLTDWCDGFLQGFLHADEPQIADSATTVRESLDDIMAISRIEIAAYANQEGARQLCEIEEYLRVATQVIFDELNPPTDSANASP